MLSTVASLISIVTTMFMNFRGSWWLQCLHRKNTSVTGVILLHYFNLSSDFCLFTLHVMYLRIYTAHQRSSTVDLWGQASVSGSLSQN